MLSVDPHHMTLRELAWMWHGRRVHDWGVAGCSMALLANINRTKKSRTYTVSDFVPADLRNEFRIGRGIKTTRSSLHALKPMFKKAE